MAALVIVGQRSYRDVRFGIDTCLGPVLDVDDVRAHPGHIHMFDSMLQRR